MGHLILGGACGPCTMQEGRAKAADRARALVVEKLRLLEEERVAEGIRMAEILAGQRVGLEEELQRMRSELDAQRLGQVPWSAVECSGVECSAVQCSEVMWSAVQCSAVKCGRVR